MRIPAALAAIVALSVTLSVTTLTGCSSAPSLFTSDGRPTQRIACDGANSWSDCFAQADSLCGASGYDIVSRSEGDAPRSVLIACRRAAQ